MATDLSKVIDPNYEIFWREVATATAQVENDTSKQIAVEVGGKHADVSWAEWADDISGIQIEIYEVEIVKEPLIVP